MIGYVPDLAEADTYLSRRTEPEQWNKAVKGSPLTGLLSTSGASTSVSGVGTLFSDELSIGDYLRKDYALYKVVTITDNTNLVVDVAMTLSSESITALNPIEAVTQTDIWTKKDQSLNTAYEEIIYCPGLTIPASPTAAELDRLKKAQMLLAGDRFVISKNERLANIRAGLKSVSIGDMSESYAAGLEEFSPWVGSFLFPFLSRNQNVRLIRQSQNTKIDDSVIGSDFYNPNA